MDDELNPQPLPKPPRQWRMDIAQSIRLMNPEALGQALHDESPDGPLSTGTTPLTLAAQFSDGELGFELALAILDAGARLDLADESGETPLIACVLHRNEAMARELLRRGARTGAQDKEGRTALMLCCERGADSLAEALLAKRADPDARTHEGHTPLMACAMRRKPQSSTIALARLLLACGAHIDAVDDAGLTALTHAALSGNTLMATLLLDSGALMSGSSPGQDAAEAARMHGHSELADMLMVRLSQQDRDAIAHESGPASASSSPSKRL